MNPQRITPCLWYDTQAREAAEFYVATFPDSEILAATSMEGTPSGSVEVLTVDLMGHTFRLMSAGPFFPFTPAISFTVRGTTGDQVDRLWERLSEGGVALMELGEYPFSPHYGWIQDRFGVSWQLTVSDDDAAQRVVPSLLFTGERYGRAEEAVRHYCEVFPDSRIGGIDKRGPGAEPEREGTVLFASFWLDNQEFIATESGLAHDFTFSAAISLEVGCNDQQQIDHLWTQLSADPAAEQCGWLKDAFGVSWQITPKVLDRMLADPDHEKVRRVTEAFLPMKKLVIAELERAYAGGERSAGAAPH